MKRILPLLFSLFLNLAFCQIITPAYPDVAYAGDTTIKHKLNVYIPTGTNQPAPCVVHIHGGGFNAGQKGQALPSFYYPPGTTFCDSLYANGYIIADINYRLSGDSIFPAAGYDCKTAIRFLKENASIYFIDTCRMGLIGESAGGYFVSFVAASQDVDSLEGFHLGSTHATSRVLAAMPMYGLSDFNYMDNYYPNVPPDSCNPYPANMNADPTSLIARFIGCAISACPTQVTASSALTYINGNEPSFGIWHGTKDCSVPPIHAQLLYDSLVAHGGDASLTLVPHASHSDPFFYTASFRQTIKTFFDSKLLISNSCTLSSIKSIEPGSNFKIYPLPAQDEITIHNSDFESSWSITFNDIAGRELISYSTINSANFKMNVSAFQKGTYLLSIRDKNGLGAFRKIIIE